MSIPFVCNFLLKCFPRASISAALSCPQCDRYNEKETKKKRVILFTGFVQPPNPLVKIVPAGIDSVCPGDWIVVG